MTAETLRMRRAELSGNRAVATIGLQSASWLERMAFPADGHTVNACRVYHRIASYR